MAAAAVEGERWLADSVSFRRDRFPRYRLLRIQGDQARGGLGYRFTV
jgi:hypothetical protein